MTKNKNVEVPNFSKNGPFWKKKKKKFFYEKNDGFFAFFIGSTKVRIIAEEMEKKTALIYSEIGAIIMIFGVFGQKKGRFGT